MRPPAKGGRPSQRVAAEPGVHADRPKGRRNGHLAAGPTRAVVRRKVEAAELARTRRENGRLGQEDDILERAAALLAEEAIASQGTAPPPPGAPASRSGRRAGAAVGGFHARSHRGPGRRREDGRRPGAGIAAVVAASRRTHGSPRVRAERRPGGRLRVRGGLRRLPAPASRPRLPDPGPGSRADGRGRVTDLAPPSTPAGKAQVGVGSCRHNGPIAGTGGEACSGRIPEPRNPRPDPAPGWPTPGPRASSPARKGAAGRARSGGRAVAAFRTLDDLDPRGKRVLVRVDFNVPMQDGEVTDATRIERAATTLKELSRQGGEGHRASHFGRPKGKRESSMSLEPIAQALARGAGRPVAFARGLRGRAGQARRRRRCRTVGWRCSRTCASTPARRRTTRRSPTSSRARRRLRQRRLLGLAPRPRLDRRAWPSASPPTPAG